MIVYGLYLLFKAIFKKSLRANIAIAVLFNLISIISYYKLQVVEKPFLPEDILLIGSALKIAGYGNLQIELVLILQVFLTIILLVIQGLITWYTKYERYNKKLTRIIIGSAAIVILLIACLRNWSYISTFKEDDYDYNLDHYHYCAIVNFCKYIYKLIEKEGTAGTATVSIYGGETSMSEFEYLTASTAKFIPDKKYPYSQAMKGDTLSHSNNSKKRRLLHNINTS